MTNRPGTRTQHFGRLVEAELARPIPVMDKLRELKHGYRELSIDHNHPLFNEPVVDIADYGIAGQGYYSHPNAATGEAVPGAPAALFLRQSIAETLAAMNAALRNPAITAFFGAEVELYVEDALRPFSLQSQLHDELIPALLRRNHPGISDSELADRLKDIIAVPSADPNGPSPHATGGAFDITLRFKQATPGYVAGSSVPMAPSDADTARTINPDHFEQHTPETKADALLQRNRRAYYAIMTGAAFAAYTGFVCNPTEWWHWGRGDQLSEKVRGHASAYYSLAQPVN